MLKTIRLLLLKILVYFKTVLPPKFSLHQTNDHIISVISVTFLESLMHLYTYAVAVVAAVVKILPYVNVFRKVTL